MEIQSVRDPRPLAVQVYDQMYAALSSRGAAANPEIPTEIELSSALGVSRTTVRQTLALLEEDGVLVRGAGRRRHIATTARQSGAEVQPLEAMFTNADAFEVFDMGRLVSPSTAWGSRHLKVPGGTPLRTWNTQFREGSLVVADSLELMTAEFAPHSSDPIESMLGALGESFRQRASYVFLQLTFYRNQTRETVPVEPENPRIVVTTVIQHDDQPAYLGKHVILLNRMPLALLDLNNRLLDS